MDIENLIESLQNAAGGPEGIKMCHAAATALSTLQTENKKLRAELENYRKGHREEAISTLTPPNEWVSAEERLPTDERPVLVFVGYADTMTGFITTSSYFCFDANPHWQWDGLVQDEQKTLFWMPLPEPPGKEG